MAYVTCFDGVIFIEGDHPLAVRRFSAKTHLTGFGMQLKNLNDLKKQMAASAAGNGCNCVVNFTYGQKARLLAIDDVTFTGDGFYAVLPEDEYKRILRALGY